MSTRKPLSSGYLDSLSVGQADPDIIQKAFQTGQFSHALAQDAILDIGLLEQAHVRDFRFERLTLFGSYRDCIFEQGEIEDCVLDEVDMENVLFKQVHFSRVIINQSTNRAQFRHRLNQVRFENCTFGTVEIQGQYGLGLRLHQAVDSHLTFQACTVFALQIDAKDSQLYFKGCQVEHRLEADAPPVLGIINLRLLSQGLMSPLQIQSMTALRLQLQDSAIARLDVIVLDKIQCEIKGGCQIAQLRLEANQVDLTSDKIRTLQEYDKIMASLGKGPAYRELTWVQLIGHAHAEFGLTGCRIGQLETHGRLVENPRWMRASYLGLSQVQALQIKGFIGAFIECKSVQLGRLVLKQVSLNGLYFIDTICETLHLESVQVARQLEWKGINHIQKAVFQDCILDNQAKVLVDELNIKTLEQQEAGQMSRLYEHINQWNIMSYCRRGKVPKRHFEVWLQGAYRAVNDE